MDATGAPESVTRLQRRKAPMRRPSIAQIESRQEKRVDWCEVNGRWSSSACPSSERGQDVSRVDSLLLQTRLSPATHAPSSTSALLCYFRTALSHLLSCLPELPFKETTSIRYHVLGNDMFVSTNRTRVRLHKYVPIYTDARDKSCHRDATKHTQKGKYDSQVCTADV